MREFRKKQKKLKLIMKVLVTVTAVLLLALIGVEPTLMENGAKSAAYALHYSGEILVVASLAVVMYYYSKYSKSDAFLTNVEYELSDCGYYMTKREEKSVSDFYKAVRAELVENAYAINENVELSELEFDLRALKRNEFIYVVTADELDKNDVIAHLDSVVYDLTAVQMKRGGNAVLMFICNSADDGAVSLSKSITTMGKKDRLKVALAIAEVGSGRVYFLGNNPTKCQQLIATLALGCDVPIEDSLKGERLPYQDELEEHMKDFDIYEYRRGNCFSH